VIKIYQLHNHKFNIGVLGFWEHMYLNEYLTLRLCVAFKDISGGQLPGISKWTGSIGAEYSIPAVLFRKSGKLFIASDAFYRSFFIFFKPISLCLFKILMDTK
jgi:hypothetical protein